MLKQLGPVAERDFCMFPPQSRIAKLELNSVSYAHTLFFYLEQISYTLSESKSLAFTLVLYVETAYLLETAYNLIA